MRVYGLFVLLALCMTLGSGAVSAVSLQVSGGGKLLPVGIVTTTLKPNCPDMSGKIEECASIGQGYVNSTLNGCPVIYCVVQVSTSLKLIKPIIIALPTTTQPTQCPDPNAAIRECKAKGLDYATIVTGNCKIIQCTGPTTTIASNCPDVQQQMDDCKLKGGQISRRYDENKCVVIDCAIPTSDCPPATQVEQTISDCKAKGLDYITYEKGGCRYAECVQPTNCPSEGDIEYAIRKCKAAGMSYQTYADSNGCRQLKCVQQSPCPTKDQIAQRIEECRKKGQGYAMSPVGGAAATYTMMAAPLCYNVECMGDNSTCQSIKDDIEACRKQNLDYEYYVDGSGCERARCQEKPGNCRPNCPTDDELKDMMLKCEANGMGYEFYTGTPVTAALMAQASQSCRRVRCVEKACPSGAELERTAKDCAAKKLQTQTYEDENGCKNMRCVQSGDCPPYQVTDDIVKACREKKLDVESYVDEKGCKNVRCKEPDAVPTVECSKIVKGDCIIVSCTDGYTFDSCNPQGVCPQVECQRFKDDKGCIVKRCTDGSESTECPNQNQPVECEVVTRDDGCLVKKCSDGKEYVSCQTSTNCKDYVDENKCKVHECDDGTKDKACPDGSQDVQCNVYTDEKGCQIKECTNGYVDNSCDKAPSCKDGKDGDCTVTTCDDGSVTRKCPTTETVDCKTYMSDDGCKVTVCTNGKEDKFCPDMGTTTTTLRPTTTTQPKGSAGGFLSNLFRSLGL